MEKISASKLLAGLVPADFIREEVQVELVTTDSREVRPGCIFVAFPGEKFDGHDFAAKALENGAVYVVVNHPVEGVPAEKAILCPDSYHAMMVMGANYRSQYHPKMVGVTGSVGKTTTKDMVAAVLGEKYRVLKTDGNFNNNIGLPLTVLRLNRSHQVAVLEMGMNHFGELDRIAKAVRPNIGVISNVGVAHIEFLGSREGILKAKCEMLAHLEKDGVAILNADNDMLQTLEGKLPQKVRWFGVEHKKDFYADEIAQVGLEKTACTIHTPIGSVRVNIPIPGVHMVLNALSAAAVGVELGLTPEQVKAGIEGFRATKNRMSIETTKDGITILNDVYNSNPVSCKASLDILANAKGRRIAVLGFMGELGDYAEEGHREVGIHAAEKGIDVLYCIGLCCDYMADAAKKAGMKEVYYLETQEEFWEKGLPTLKAGDTILLKASRSREFEKTVAKLQGVN